MTSMPWSRVIRLDGAVVRETDPGCSVLDWMNLSLLGPAPIEVSWGLFRLNGWGFDLDEAFVWNQKWVAGIRAIKLPSCLLRKRLRE